MTDPYSGPVADARRHRVTAKLANMRKTQDFLVSPMSDGRIMIQSDKAIGAFDFRTRQGVLNTKGCYFMYLNPIMGAQPFEFPDDFVAACLEACPAQDSVTEMGGVVIHNTVQVFGGDQ